MLRSGKALIAKGTAFVGNNSIPAQLQNAIWVQQVRGLRPRKPPYSGMAKSKLFRIPKRTEFPPDEREEIRRISNQYRLYMRSISNYLKELNESHAIGSHEAEKELAEDEAEWQKSLVQISQWNEEIAALRNERLQKEKTVKEEEIRLNIINEQRAHELRLQEIDEIVRREKELSKSYVTPDNIDKAVMEALENKSDFNYAVDVRGNKFTGRFLNASGTEDLPQGREEQEEDSLPSLFQSSPISSENSSRK